MLLVGNLLVSSWEHDRHLLLLGRGISRELSDITGEMIKMYIEENKANLQQGSDFEYGSFTLIFQIKTV